MQQLNRDFIVEEKPIYEEEEEEEAGKKAKIIDIDVEKVALGNDVPNFDSKPGVNAVRKLVKEICEQILEGVQRGKNYDKELGSFREELLLHKQIQDSDHIRIDNLCGLTEALDRRLQDLINKNMDMLDFQQRFSDF